MTINATEQIPGSILSAQPHMDRVILTVRNERVILDADLAWIYGVATRVLNQAVKRNLDRFPADFCFCLTAAEKEKVITNCDHLAKLRYAKALPHAFTEHGALMAATVLNSPRAVTMSLFIIRAFVKLREKESANAAILKRLAEIDRTLLVHDSALRDIYRKLLPLLRPAPGGPKQEIGFHTLKS